IYGSDVFSSSSYRRIFGDSPRFASSPSRVSSRGGGNRSSSLSRTSISSVGSYSRKSARSFSAPLEAFDLTQSSILNNEYKIIRTNEKEQMQGLNDRFAMFIEKVRNLEQHNKVLETELVALRQRQAEPSRLAEVYQQEIRELRSQLEELNGEKSQLVIERDSIDDDLQKLREKYEEEFRAREEAEATLKAFKKDASRSNDAIRASREEANEFRRQLQSKTIEIESLRGTTESLEKQLREMEDRHNDVNVGYIIKAINNCETLIFLVKSQLYAHVAKYFYSPSAILL
uniref:Internexin neuronal intermediate filament protein, alpha b n=1 Tax=Xiphophorus couchianus TaxID=32473 RepID=A0A3B5LZR4_9TELE